LKTDGTEELFLKTDRDRRTEEEEVKTTITTKYKDNNQQQRFSFNHKYKPRVQKVRTLGYFGEDAAAPYVPQL
jgi:hypothetical protein